MTNRSLFFTSLFTILHLLWSCTLYANGCCYTSIISFGDSLGNLKQLITNNSELNRPPFHLFLPPYGETFFHKPTSRCSNGRLIIDFIDCSHLIGDSLFLMGEIGGNDYNFALLSGKPIDEVETYVPFVIDTIISAINEVIDLGAKTIVVPGNLPIGCSATYLTLRHSFDKTEYENLTGCLIKFNKFAEYHNELLVTKLSQIRELHPDANIIYVDYYNAAMQFFRSPKKYGFENGALKACCGGGGEFNFNASIPCANPLSTVCAQPDTYANWDGLHLTEAEHIKSLLRAYCKDHTLCPNLTPSAQL